MTINLANNNPRIEYSVAQSATQQTFAVPFEFFDDGDLSVYVDGVLKTGGSDYTTTGGDGSTGTVVFTVAVTGATGGSTVVIVRSTAIERTSDFSAGADINRAALNEQLDILTAMMADAKDRTDRTIRLNPYEVAADLTLPSVNDRKGTVLAFDPTTADVIVGPTIDEVSNAETFANQAIASAASASSSASIASSAASSASAFASTAESARDATLAAYDNFDDRYLGAKSSAPTVDNDGNALLTGALYWNTASNVMFVWSGSAWNQTVIDSSNIVFTSDIGVTVQAYDAELAAIAGLAVTDGNFIVGNGSTWVVENGETARTSLGLGSIATQASSNVSITGGSISGITDLAIADGGTGASNAAAARTNLGLAIGTNVQAYDADLAAIAALSSNGMIARTGAGAASVRTITGTANQITVTNGDGVSDNPTISIPANPQFSGAVLNDGYTEEVFAVTGTTPALSPNNGSIQTWTLSANSTPTAGTWAEGQSITLMVDDGSGFTITWTSLSVTWKTDGGVAPTLNTSGFTAIALWKVGSTIYGARVGDA